MKAFIISVILTIFTSLGYSQLLRGEWEGHFSDNGTVYPIFLEFVLNTDSSYSVFSYSKAASVYDFFAEKKTLKKDLAIICTVYYELLSQDSVYLEELKIIQPENYTQSCLQKMYLKIKIKEDKIELFGKWKSDGPTCRGSGKIGFWKKKNIQLPEK